MTNSRTPSACTVPLIDLGSGAMFLTRARHAMKRHSAIAGLMEESAEIVGRKSTVSFGTVLSLFECSQFHPRASGASNKQC